MKKFIVALLFLLPSVSNSAQDRQGSMRPSVWLSSRTVSADSFVQLSSAPNGNGNACIFHGVIIGSPTVNINDSYISFFNSTTTATASFAFSTMVFINTGMQVYVNTTASGTTIMPNQNPPFYDIIFSSGIVYNKKGNADINILWDYLMPSFGR